MTIDWSRVAKPQDDGYDIQILRQHLVASRGWEKHQPNSVLTMCEGMVAIDDERYFAGPTMASFVEIHERMPSPEDIAKVEKYLKGWPTGYLSLQGFLDEFWPKAFRKPHPGVRGSSSGNEIHEGKNCVYVTVDDPQGCAAGIYHETGHLRLKALGIDLETHDGRLLQNAPTELYDSPVRFDKKRPMSAVVHGLYSWLMFCENDIQCGELYNREDSCIYLQGNIPKIANGLNEVRCHLKTTEAGATFFDSMLSWGDDIVRRGQAMIG
jgi:hypothetical protein